MSHVTWAMSRHLWTPPITIWTYDNFLFQKWKEAKELEMRIKMAQSGRFKQYRRYMKNHDNRMTFDDS